MRSDTKATAGATATNAAGGLWRRVLALSPLGKSSRPERRPREGQSGEFHSAEYWEERYKSGGNSGLGSYGKLAAFKAQFINAFIREHHIKRLLDFGCGDSNQAGFIEVENYLGLDVSPSVLQRCRDRFKDDPRRRFLLYDQATFEADMSLFNADLAISMDVVFHLVEEPVFVKYMGELFGGASRHVIIYSTNFDKSHVEPHHKDRQFTAYVKELIPDWILAQTLVNPYKGEEVQADFFVYSKRTPAVDGHSGSK